MRAAKSAATSSAYILDASPPASPLENVCHRLNSGGLVLAKMPDLLQMCFKFLRFSETHLKMCFKCNSPLAFSNVVHKNTIHQIIARYPHHVHWYMKWLCECLLAYRTIWQNWRIPHVECHSATDMIIIYHSLNRFCQFQYIIDRTSPWSETVRWEITNSLDGQL